MLLVLLSPRSSSERFGAGARPVHPIRVLLVGLRPDGREAKQFRLGLRDLGYSEGRDVVIEWRSANGDYDRLPNLVADLVQRKVDLIVQDSTVGTEVTKRATSTIPIVMVGWQTLATNPIDQQIDLAA